MQRIILGCVAGIVAAFMTVFVIEGAGHMLFPPPVGIDLKNPADLARLMDVVPFGAKLAVVIGWIVGAFIGTCRRAQNFALGSSSVGCCRRHDRGVRRNACGHSPSSMDDSGCCRGPRARRRRRAPDRERVIQSPLTRLPIISVT